MIVGMFLRYFKTYQGINYIPLTDEDNFCGLVGENGIGKSSILEALDSFFNGKAWNHNTVTIRSGKATTKPHIVPIFLIKNDELQGQYLEKAKILNDLALNITDIDVSPANRANMKSFIDHRERLKQKINLDDYLLIPIGFDYNHSTSVAIFNTRPLVEKIMGAEAPIDKTNLADDELNEFSPLLEKLKSQLEYIYIPREIDPEMFTRLETEEIQILMGETLNQILMERVPVQQITDINKSLTQFLDTLATELEIYSYRTTTQLQQNLKRKDVYNLIIQAFFNIRKLHKKQGSHWLEIGALSSGEKQKAIIDIAHSLLSRHRKSGENLIIGIDEPESSLHMSACFDQFISLYNISRDCRQVLFSSHWYGFLPTIESGSTAIITKSDTNHQFDLINLANYREQVRQMTSTSKGTLPYDIRLKSVNDFVQSVITSSIGESPFNWIICEGTSEKLYLTKYLDDLIKTKKLRIVPVGGAKEIKRIYNHIASSYDDFKDEITGKIILISDTDTELVRYEVSQFENLLCKRIVNCGLTKDTKLVNIQSNPVSPATEIEDCLNGKLFLQTLTSFSESYPDELSFITEIPSDVSEASSYTALDLKPTDSEKLKDFFKKDNNKYLFAKTYSENIGSSFSVPQWIQEIRSWLT